MNRHSSFRTPPAVAAWILTAAFCNAGGWILSALHRLDAIGYLGLAAALAFVIVAWRRFGPEPRGTVGPKTLSFALFFRKQRRRFTRLFPLAFLALALLAALGGALHAPNNYDALAYRTPRVLNWLAEGQWHWIHTGFQRLNTRGSGMEWMTAPLFVFLRTDRFDFVLNLIPFALLPGRVFSLLIRLGARRRVAWYWMWLLPTGYGYLLQAGSISNDMFGAWFALASIELALRARETGSLAPAWLSLLAAALATASKAFNVLLILPWGIAMIPVLRLLLRRPLASTAVVCAGVLCSIAPTAFLNWRHCGDWSGSAAEKAVAMGGGAPLLHLGVNASLLMINSFAPPIFPLGKQFGQAVDRSLPPNVIASLNRIFESPVPRLFRIDELPIEENAGLGFGISLLLAAVLVCKLAKRRGRAAEPTRFFSPPILIPLGALAASIIFLAQSGLSCPARYLVPFFPLLVAPILAGVRVDEWMRRRGLQWRWCGALVFGLAAVVLILSPARPLWPAQSVLQSLGGEKASSGLVRRAWTVYRVYAGRADAFEPVLRQLPAGVRRLGFLTADDPETSLWRPFGSRRIVHVTCEDDAEWIRGQDIKYLLASSWVLSQHCQCSLDEWLRARHMTLVTQLTLGLRAEKGPADWYLLRFDPPAAPPQP